MSGPKSVEISQGIQERERDPVQEEVLKTRGRDIKDGAVAIVTLVGNGQLVTRGGNLGSTIPLSQLVSMRLPKRKRTGQQVRGRIDFAERCIPSSIVVPLTQC